MLIKRVLINKKECRQCRNKCSYYFCLCAKAFTTADLSAFLFSFISVLLKELALNIDNIAQQKNIHESGSPVTVPGDSDGRVEVGTQNRLFLTVPC